MKRVTLAVNGFRVNEWRQFPPCSLNRGPSFLSRDCTCYWYWILCKKKRKKGLMNGQPWQRMEDVINYEAIVKSIHCYVRLEMRRSTMWIMEYFKKIIHSENSHSFFFLFRSTESFIDRDSSIYRLEVIKKKRIN